METKYNLVKKKVKSYILEGYVLPHQKIGSENELMKKFAVSRHTIRKAIDDLVNEGWVYRKQGAGTFCADRTNIDNKTKSKSRKNIALITTYFSDYIFPSIIRGAEGYLSAKDYQVTIFSTNNDHEQEKRALEAVLTGNFDGLIIEPTKSALPSPNMNYFLNFERHNIPYLMINAYYEVLEPNYLVVHDEHGGYIQAKHLLELGHEKIIGLFKEDDIQGIKRMRGFIRAHREFGFAVDPSLLVTYSTENKNVKPHEVVAQLLNLPKVRPTAVVCYNDELAISLLEITREMNLTIPGELSIVGFDNSFMATASEIKLTTVNHPQVEMGVDAAKLMINLIEKDIKQYQQGALSKVYESKLVIRQSTLKA